MYFQDRSYDERKTRPGFWQNEFEFHPDKRGSCNHRFRNFQFYVGNKFTLWQYDNETFQRFRVTCRVCFILL